MSEKTNWVLNFGACFFLLLEEINCKRGTNQLFYLCALAEIEQLVQVRYCDYDCTSYIRGEKLPPPPELIPEYTPALSQLSCFLQTHRDSLRSATLSIYVCTQARFIIPFSSVHFRWKRLGIMARGEYRGYSYSSKSPIQKQIPIKNININNNIVEIPSRVFDKVIT